MESLGREKVGDLGRWLTRGQKWRLKWARSSPSIMLGCMRRFTHESCWNLCATHGRTDTERVTDTWTDSHRTLRWMLRSSRTGIWLGRHGHFIIAWTHTRNRARLSPLYAIYSRSCDFESRKMEIEPECRESDLSDEKGSCDQNISIDWRTFGGKGEEGMEHTKHGKYLCTDRRWLRKGVILKNHIYKK